MVQVLAYPVPTKGLNTHEEPTAFSGSFSPFIKNAYVSPTLVRKRRGISKVGSRALPLPGVGLKLVTYVDAVGDRHEIAITTTSAFKYNGSTDSWDDITPGILLSNCAANWTDGVGAASADTVAEASLPGSPPSGKAVLIDCVADVADGNLLAFIALGSAIDVSAHTEIRLWVYPVGTGLSANSLELVITEEVDGTTGGVDVQVETHDAAPADTWTRLAFTVDLSSIDGAQSIAVYANHATEFDALDLYIDEFLVVTPFAGNVNIPMSYTLATDTVEFSNNQGTALVIANGVDDMFYFEGQSGDKFQTLVHASGISSCRILAEFWNHLMYINYDDGDRQVKTLLYSAAGDVDDHTSDNAGANTLTDTIGEILNAVKLGSMLVIYSENSITVGRYYGGLTTFTFPTLIFGTGVIAANAIVSIANVHLILGSDQKVYAYYGDTDLVPIGEAVEAQLFTTLDVSKRLQIVSGVDRCKFKAHFFLHRTGSVSYANLRYCFNYRRSEMSWEIHEVSRVAKDLGGIQAGFDWYCDEDPLQDIYCDESSLYCDDGSGQTGYEQPAFISDDGYVYKLDEVTGKDDITNIVFELWTPEFIIGAEEQYGRWTWFSFQALSSVVDSIVDVFYSVNGGSNWVHITGVSLNQQWTTHRLPIDVTSRRIMFRFYQSSNKDIQLRGLFKCFVEPQPERD